MNLPQEAPLTALKDRRDNHRWDKVFSVYITGAWGSTFGIARNISEGGMFIETHEPYPLGSRMQVTFSFPDANAEIAAVAEVMHLVFINKSDIEEIPKVMAGMGIRFLYFFNEEIHQEFSLDQLQ